jgi:hypothetical protein
MDGRHDFDFIFGRWNVHNHRLRRPLSGTQDWYEFEATTVERPVWGGLANLEEWVAAESPVGPINGLALRLYNPRTQQWSIYWGTAQTGVLGIPSVGSFIEGRGEFYDEEEYEGRPILLRFVWSDITETSAKWEQAFSLDAGESWEINWTMHFRRIPE